MRRKHALPLGTIRSPRTTLSYSIRRICLKSMRLVFATLGLGQSSRVTWFTLVMLGRTIGKRRVISQQGPTEVGTMRKVMRLLSLTLLRRLSIRSSTQHKDRPRLHFMFAPCLTIATHRLRETIIRALSMAQRAHALSMEEHIRVPTSPLSKGGMCLSTRPPAPSPFGQCRRLEMAPMVSALMLKLLMPA